MLCKMSVENVKNVESEVRGVEGVGEVEVDVVDEEEVGRVVVPVERVGRLVLENRVVNLMEMRPLRLLLRESGR